MPPDPCTKTTAGSLSLPGGRNRWPTIFTVSPTLPACISSPSVLGVQLANAQRPLVAPLANVFTTSGAWAWATIVAHKPEGRERADATRHRSGDRLLDGRLHDSVESRKLVVAESASAAGHSARVAARDRANFVAVSNQQTRPWIPVGPTRGPHGEPRAPERCLPSVPGRPARLRHIGSRDPGSIARQLRRRSPTHPVLAPELLPVDVDGGLPARLKTSAAFPQTSFPAHQSRRHWRAPTLFRCRTSWPQTD